LEAISQQIEELAPEEKRTLPSLLIERLRRQGDSTHRLLADYYGPGKGRGFRTAQEVDSLIE
jgi:hypothetical protein